MKYPYKIRLTACIFVAAAVLGSCGESSERELLPEPATTDPSVTDTLDADTESKQSSTETGDDGQKHHMTEKLTALSCLDCGEMQPDLAYFGSGKLLAMTWQFSGDGISATQLRLIDIYEDTVIAEGTVSGYAEFASASEEGCILRNYDSPSFCMLNAELEVIRTYQPESMNGKFSPDGKYYYQVICGKLYREETESGMLTRIDTSVEPEFSEYVGGICCGGRYADLSYDKFTDGIYDQTAAIRVDLSSGNVEMLTYDINMPSYSDTYMYSREVSEEGDIEMLYCIALSDYTCTMIPISQYFTEFVSGSDYMVCTPYSGGDQTPRYLARMDETGRCRAAILNSDASDAFLSGFVYMPQDELIACCVQEGDDMSGDTLRVCLVDPSLFDYSTEFPSEQIFPPVLYDEQIYADYLAASAIPECPARLDALRNRADALEEQYGIQIYLSSECSNFVQDIAYDCTDAFFDNEEEQLYLSSALREMEEALEKYPDGFFRQFRCRTGDGGIRICLTAYIHDDFSAAYAVKNGAWYNIVMDVRYNCTINLTHELWHSTESLISAKDYTLLSDEQWDRLNPEGFVYSSDFRENTAAISEYCYDYDYEWYFYDNYSKSNSLEDKARIMEIVMNPDSFPCSEFLASEHIQNKLACMSDAIRRTFDTAGWGEEVYWERFAS